jgi:hypothetical protein
MLATKNPFANTPPVPAPSPSETSQAESVVKAGKQLFRWRAEQGRTKAKVKSLTSTLEAARLALAQTEQTLGERLGDELDTTEATEAVKRADGRVRALEAAVTVAIQKDEAAQAALRHAERQEKIEKEVEAVAQLKTVILKWDQLVIDLNRLTVDEIGPALNAARLLLSMSGIRDGELNFLNKVPLEAKRHLLLAVHTLIGEGFVPANMNPYERLSQLIPDDEFVRSRARPGPTTARPIPNWQVSE